MTRRIPVGLLAGLLFIVSSVNAQPVRIEAPVGTALPGAGFRGVVVVPGRNAGFGTAGNSYNGLGGSQQAGFAARQFNAPATARPISPVPSFVNERGETGALESVESFSAQPKIQVSQYPVYNGGNAAISGLQGFADHGVASLGGTSASFSPEKAQTDGAKMFDNNFYAKKGEKGAPVVAPAPAPAPRPSKTLRNNGKTETSKSHMPIHRPEEGGASTYEPGLYSPSRLGEFDWNKDDYILHWVFRHKKNDPKVVEAFMGGIAHQAMEQISHWLRGGKRAEDFTIEDVIEAYNTFWEEQYEDGKYKLDKGFTLEDYRRRGETFVRNMWSRYYPFNQGKVLFFERKMLFYVEEAATGKRYRFQGIPDLVKLYEDENMIEISDWKTTNFEKTVDQLKEHDFQLALYVLALRQNFPELTKGRNFRLKWNFNGTFQIINVTEEYLAAVQDRVITKIHEIENAEAMAEANRAEWERRINPVKAPKEMSDAQKLVDRWTKLHWKQETLAKELKELEAEEEAIIERLLEFSKKTGHTTIPGKVKDAVLTEKENVKVPTKSGDSVNYEKLSQLIKEAGLWEQFSSLDLNEIKNMAKVQGHPHHDLYEKIKSLVEIGMKRDLKLKDRVEDVKKKKK